MADLAATIRDLAEEHSSLDAVVASLREDTWDKPTPSAPWSIRDQISHLAFFDEQARLAATDPDAFVAGLAEIAKDVDGFVNGSLERGRALTPSDVLEWWRAERGRMIAAFEELDPSLRVPWYGPPMNPVSFVTARLMETWAHGQDVVDALGIERSPTARLRHVCHIGVRARPFSYMTRGLTVPDEEVGVVLRGPQGQAWKWNDEAQQRITGSALGFALVVTQRRHPEDIDLVAQGPLAEEWLGIAQAFAGPPGEGRAPGQFEKVTG